MSRNEGKIWNRRLAVIAARVAIAERKRREECEKRRAEWEIPEPPQLGGIHAERAALIDRFFEKRLIESLRTTGRL